MKKIKTKYEEAKEEVESIKNEITKGLKRFIFLTLILWVSFSIFTFIYFPILDKDEYDYGDIISRSGAVLTIISILIEFRLLSIKSSVSLILRCYEKSNISDEVSKEFEKYKFKILFLITHSLVVFGTFTWAYGDVFYNHIPFFMTNLRSLLSF